MTENPSSDGYRLKRDNYSSTRLVAQHYLWAATCGFNLHPRVSPASVGAVLRIADIGTGTGIWVSDTRSGQDGFHIDGFDMSLQQCPPSELVPKNCSFRELNVLHELPKDLHGVYDIVHARLIQGGLNKDDPGPALKNLIAMLKPGGWLQWQEINLPSLQVTTTKPDLDHFAMDELVKGIHNFQFGKWVGQLAEICSEHGLVESRTDRYDVPPHIVIPFTQTQLGAYEEISWMAMDNRTPDSQGFIFRKTLQRAWKELDAGVTLGHWLDVTVARKPL